MSGIDKNLSSRHVRVVIGGIMSAFVVAMCTLTGCMNCNDQFCKVAKKVGFDIYWIRTLCCEDSERRYCDQIVPLIPQLTSLIVDMQLACDQANWQRMRQIWGEIKGLGMPVPFVKYYQDLFCEETIDIGLNSHPFFVPSDHFRFPGIFAATGEPTPIVIFPDDIESPWMDQTQGRRNLLEAPEVLWETEYVLEPGAVFNVETWLGAQDFSATGSLAIARSDVSIGESCEIARFMRMRIDLLGLELAGHIELVPSSAQSALKLDAFGSGTLAGLIDVHVYLRDDPSISLDGLFQEAWIELPVVVQGESIVLAPEGMVDGLSLFPVVPEIAELLYGVTPEALALHGDDEFSECQEVGLAALRSLQRDVSGVL